MPISFEDAVTIRRILIIQFVVLLVVSILLAIKDPKWGVAGLAGGLALYVPNVIFVFITQCKDGQSPWLGTVTWTFFVGWLVKILITVLLLIIKIGIFKNEFIPLGIAFLSVMFAQRWAPLVINSYCYIRSRKIKRYYG